jgi:hypothetical protein
MLMMVPEAMKNTTAMANGKTSGVPNEATALLKDAVLKAAETAGGGEPDGLVNYLVAQAKQNPVAFMTLLGEVLPTQVSGEGDGNIIVEIVSLELISDSGPRRRSESGQ